MLRILSALTGGIWGYVIIGLVAASVSAAATFSIVRTAKNLEISELKLSVEKTRADDASSSLNKLNEFISRMQLASTNYQTTLSTIETSFASLQRDFSNVSHKKPLPVDCKPDIERLRVLSAAVAAANKSATSAH